MGRKETQVGAFEETKARIEKLQNNIRNEVEKRR
jgi:hypothetical protein